MVFPIALILFFMRHVHDDSVVVDCGHGLILLLSSFAPRSMGMPLSRILQTVLELVLIILIYMLNLKDTAVLHVCLSSGLAASRVLLLLAHLQPES